ncbi:ribonuclease P protein component [Candidatus Microgenomates bacterium]|jgi:ribonuclease P protein component|nr:ribonuclease P protein component [Candidatus Microgenomates bacterium]
MLPKRYRLLAKEFQFTYKKGTKFRGKYGMLVCAESKNTSPHIGFVVSKKIGNAVQRHHMTRLLRVVFIEAISKYSMENISLNYQYIAFEFCDELELLKKDIFSQIEQSLSR